MEFGFVDNNTVEISDELVNSKVEEIINRPNSIVATKEDLENLKNNLSINMDFGVF